MADKSLTFEESYKRLEEILEKMNSGHVPLEEAIKLYEEADLLITGCQHQLVDAEERVRILLKNKEGGIKLDADQRPVSEPFIPLTQSALK